MQDRTLKDRFYDNAHIKRPLVVRDDNGAWCVVTPYHAQRGYAAMATFEDALTVADDYWFSVRMDVDARPSWGEQIRRSYSEED